MESEPIALGSAKLTAQWNGLYEQALTILNSFKDRARRIPIGEPNWAKLPSNGKVEE